MLFEGSLVCVSLVALVAKVSPQCVSSCASVNHKKKHKHSCTGYTCSAFLPFGAFPIAAWEEISFQQKFFFKTSFFSSQGFLNFYSRPPIFFFSFNFSLSNFQSYSRPPIPDLSRLRLWAELYISNFSFFLQLFNFSICFLLSF